VTEARVRFVDTYVVRRSSERLEVLVLRRSSAGRCPGSWETVHGTIEPAETPVQASLREVREETGLVPERLYNLSRVEMFYRHGEDEVALIPVFVAFVSSGAQPRVSAEHDRAEWLTLAAAADRVAWPRERRALEDIGRLFPKDDAGVLDDVLRVC
jgi:8-oxo-dGTP pyrophosphatase MutT (NUDIX family)